LKLHICDLMTQTGMPLL